MKKKCRIWIFTCLTLLLIVSCSSPATNNKEQYVHPFQAETMNLLDVKAMAWQGNNNLWIGNQAGVARINVMDGTIEVFEDIACPRLFVTLKSEDVWCSTINYVNRYDGISWHRFDIEAYQIIETGDGTIWAGTMQGLARFDITQQEWTYVIKVAEISPKFTFSTGPGIHLSFQSNDGALWFYSYSNDYTGITRWTETSYKTWLPAGDFTMIRPMLETLNGDIWGGGDDGVIGRWDGYQWQIWYPFRLKSTIGGMIEAQDGSIWVFAVVDGVARWSGQTWEVWSRDEDILQNCPGISEKQKCVLIDSNIEYYPVHGLGKSGSDNPRLDLTALIETQDGYVWVGTAHEGISKWGGNEWRNYTVDDGLSSEAITTLLESPDGKLWAGTLGGGVNLYNPETDHWQPLDLNR